MKFPWAILLCLVGLPAFAELEPLILDGLGGDQAALIMESEYVGAVHYSNSARQNSTSGSWALTDGDLTCEIEVEARGGAEGVGVVCPAGWIVDPPYAEVMDGDEFVFGVSAAAF